MKQLSIRKILNFEDWSKTSELVDFSYPWDNEKSPETVFNAYYDDEFLFFRFKSFCVKPLIYIENNNKLEVIHSERVEIFFRINEKMSPYYCLEIDPIGRVLDYKAEFYRNFDRTWQWPSSLSINTFISEDNYEVTGKISLATLKNLNLINNNQIQIGLYRGHCIKLDGDKSIIKWISWIDSKSENPDFHIPSSFGILNFN
jgi:hypothetical protein